MCVSGSVMSDSLQVDCPVHGVLQARTQDSVAISIPRGSSRPRDGTCVCCVSYIDRWILHHCATWEASSYLFAYLIQGLRSRSYSINVYILIIEVQMISVSIIFTNVNICSITNRILHFRRIMRFAQLGFRD